MSEIQKELDKIKRANNSIIVASKDINLATTRLEKLLQEPPTVDPDPDPVDPDPEPDPELPKFDKANLPFLIESPVAPSDLTTVRVKNNQELQDQLMYSGGNVKIIVDFDVVDLPKDWEFKLDDHNTNIYINFKNATINIPFAIFGGAKQVRINGGNFKQGIKFYDNPTDLTLVGVTIDGTSENSAEIRGTRIKCKECIFEQANRAALWSDKGLSHALFEECIFMDSIKESTVRVYDCNKVAFLNCEIYCRLLAAGGIKAAGRMINSPLGGFFGCVFVGGGLWMGMPPGTGGSVEQGEIIADLCTFFHFSTVNHPIETYETLKPTVKNCKSVSSTYDKMLGTPIAGYSWIEENNTHYKVDTTEQVKGTMPTYISEK